MHDLEEKLVSYLESGTEPTVPMLGGIDALKNTIPAIGSSPILPEFVRIIVNSNDIDDSGERCSIICGMLAKCQNGMAMRECVDLLDQFDANHSENNGQLFDTYLKAAVNDTIEPLARASTLDGALRHAIVAPQKRFRLLDVLTGLDLGGSTEFPRWAAKIIGVANSHWPCDDLERKLHQCRDVEAARDEADFELGMSSLAKALASFDSNTVAAKLHDARFWFKSSIESSLDRPDAKLFLLCLEVLTNFSDGQLSHSAESLTNRIDESVLDLQVSHRSQLDPPWLGVRTVEVVLWQQLSQALCELDNKLLEPAWYEPAVVIEQYLLPVYSANRSVLKLNQEGGIESLVRPRIEGTLAATTAQGHLLRNWMRKNLADELASDATLLITQADKLASESADDRFLVGKCRSTKLDSLIQDSTLLTKDKALILEAIHSAFAVHLATLTDAEQTVVVKCLRAVESHPDYCKSEDSKQLFNTLLLWTVAFVRSRLEMTKGNEKAVSYLFRRADGKRAKENDLQSDFKTFMETNVAGTKIEVPNIGGGRADVYFQLSAERMVVELKREEKDCSFDALKQAYSSQTVDYQNISARLGFILVLDQTDRNGGSMHISELVKPIELVRQGETEPRFLVIVKVPGERLRPSEQTKLAKKEQRRHKREQGKKIR